MIFKDRQMVVDVVGERICYDQYEEKEMIYSLIKDAIKKLKSNSIEDQVEARNFFYYRDSDGVNAFEYWLDHMLPFDYDLDPDVARRAIMKQVKECKKNGENKNNDGRRHRPTKPSCHDRNTGASGDAEESFWLEAVFGG